MPYEMDYSLIGTTEIPFEGDPSKARISEDEIVYLCAAVSRYFRKPLSPRDVVESFSGVRPLYDDGAKNASAATRDYVLDLDAPEGGAPLLSVFGGKITTYRRLAEDAIERLAPHLKPPCATNAGLRRRRCPAATWKTAISTGFCARCAANILGSTPLLWPAWPARMARGRR